MLEETCWVPWAACCTLREISCVAAPCSSTAAAMVEAISEQPFDGAADLLDRSYRLLGGALDTGDLLADLAGAFAVCSASAFTSEATTAKPRPASPARAASMVALSASRLVWPAMVLMSSTTSPMRAAAFDNSLTRSLVCGPARRPRLAIRADSWTWRLISLTEEDSSSVAEATDCTLVVASSEAAATMVVTCLRALGGRRQRAGGRFEFGRSG
jgi:hypothetical protein